MNNRILIEPSSQRSDNKTWVWKYADSVSVPFRIKFYDTNSGDLQPAIPTTYRARMLIKDDLRDMESILDKYFDIIDSSVFVAEFTTDEVTCLRAGKVYHVGVALYDESDNFVRTLISDLPLRIDNSTFSNSVY